MIIIAGMLQVDPAERDRYLTAVADVSRLARQAPGCFDFSQAPDELDAGRINVFERWESDEHLHAFRDSGGPDMELPPILAAEVRKYRIAAVEEP
ncbi:putative quinol monooxygenase [Actinoplanes aureus]|uniref:Antibiotic biosynthesis monooxygenase n=1 Tax=Actinoplanes aureus TaxID=2792083 RepID=A0A931CP01_9ACTN|nr:antibiotic biosynthesis monooxygenase family protein [Actinoplanes aureus]MBG0568405.1 antibiotic biosynthesis monooxygenase [Actinoplanes aureus]